MADKIMDTMDQCLHALASEWRQRGLSVKINISKYPEGYVTCVRVHHDNETVFVLPLATEIMIQVLCVEPQNARRAHHTQYKYFSLFDPTTIDAILEIGSSPRHVYEY